MKNKKIKKYSSILLAGLVFTSPLINNNFVKAESVAVNDNVNVNYNNNNGVGVLTLNAKNNIKNIVVRATLGGKTLVNTYSDLYKGKELTINYKKEDFSNNKVLPHTSVVRENVQIADFLGSEEIKIEIVYEYNNEDRVVLKDKNTQNSKKLEKDSKLSEIIGNESLENNKQNDEKLEKDTKPETTTNNETLENSDQNNINDKQEELSLDSVVEIKDAGLKKFLLDNFYKYEGIDIESGIEGEYVFKLVDNNYRKSAEEKEILVRDLLQLEQLSLQGYYDFFAFMNAESEEEIEALKLEVRDLSGLEVAKNLKLLSISSHDTENKFSPNGLKDITKLEKLQNLELLRLSHNAIEDISVVTKLPKLKKLYLSHNLITNIEPLANMTNLEKLDLSKNDIRDISSLINLTNLKELTLRDAGISSIDATKNMTNMEILEIRENNINNIEVLSNFSKLKEILLDSNNVNDFTVLDNLKELIYVSSGNQAINSKGEQLVTSKNFERESSYTGLNNVIQGDVTVQSSVEGINISLNETKDKLNITLTDQYVTENNNKKTTFDITYVAKNKFKFLGNYEEFEYKENNVTLDLQITDNNSEEKPNQP